jgi:uncharacterized membrane protein YeaQ/YmgE (transglycosylase-associated protein family)
MFQGKRVGRILLAVTLCPSCSSYAYGWSSDSFLWASIRQKEETMAFVVWIVLGLAAGCIGSRLADSRGKNALPDILLGVAGALTGGWLYYAFGPPAVNGFHLISHFAAFIGSLVFLFTYYAVRRI